MFTRNRHDTNIRRNSVSRIPRSWFSVHFRQEAAGRNPVPRPRVSVYFPSSRQDFESLSFTIHLHIDWISKQMTTSQRRLGLVPVLVKRCARQQPQVSFHLNGLEIRPSINNLTA
jgi:hypothetical protein